MALKLPDVRLSPFSITLFYACIGGIWLLFASSHVLSALFSDRIPFAIINQSVFVLMSAWILYFLIQRSEAGIKRRKEALSRLNRALQAYSGCHQALMRATDGQQLMEEICRIIVEVGGYRVAWVGRAEQDEAKSIRPVAQWGDYSGYLITLEASWGATDRGRGPTGIAIRTGEPVVVQQIRYDPRWELWREKALAHGFEASISLPLMIGKKSYGALVIFAGEPKAFDADEVKLLVELADDLSYGMTSRLISREREEAAKDVRLLASVIEQAKEGIILCDAEGRIQYINPAVTAITGYRHRQLLGATISSLDPDGPNSSFHQALWEAFSRGERRVGRFTYTGSDGRIFDLDATTWGVTDEEERLLSHVALIRDVTVEVQLERQLRCAQRMEAIGTLAGGIAHDFNNSLASIITCAEMALDEVVPGSPMFELIDVILKSGHRGRNLVRQILTFSRRGEQERQEVQVELIVGECLKLLRASLPSAIDIRLTLGDRLGRVHADPTQIHQIIMNLCTNAAQAMQNRIGVMEIALANVDVDATNAAGYPELAPGNYLRLTVKDTGHGMDRETLERIFDPFFTTKGQAEGTGLGLSVIHGIVKNLEGTIVVESEPERGSTFHVLLPRTDAACAEGEEEGQAALPRGFERILLVDDEAELVFAGKRMLELLGYRVVATRDSRHALDLFTANPRAFDLVITDQTMPYLQGTDLARAMIELRPDIPIILCTGYEPAASGARTCAGDNAPGIRELALKPINRAEIAAIIRRILDDGRIAGESVWQTS